MTQNSNYKQLSHEERLAYTPKAASEVVYDTTSERYYAWNGTGWLLLPEQFTPRGES